MSDKKIPYKKMLKIWLIFIATLFIIYVITKIAHHNNRFDPTPTKEHNLQLAFKKKGELSRTRHYSEYTDLCLNSNLSISECLPLISLVNYKVRYKRLGHVQNWKKCFDVKLARSIERARISKKCKTSESPSNISETDLLQSMESEYISVKIYDNCFNYKSETLKNIIDDHMYEYGKICDKETRMQT